MSTHKGKNCITGILFFSLAIGITLLWWNFVISNAWLSRVADANDIAFALKNKQGDVNARDASGWTGLMVAVELGDVERARLLLRYHADPNLVSHDLNRCTALHMLCRKSFMSDRNMEIMKLLISHGAHIHALDAYGRQPIHWIGGIGDPHFRTQVLDLLMHHGANLNAQDRNGDTPLNCMIDYLWSRGEALTWFKESLFAKYGNLIDPHIRNKKGYTSLDFARKRRYIPIIQLLCSTGKWVCTSNEKLGIYE